MATIQHSALTDSDGLHEPKGVSTATSGDVYVADGAGSGSWDPLEGTEVASTGESVNTYLAADGSAGAAWQAVQGTHVGSSGPIAAGYVLEANGSGGAAWTAAQIYGGIYAQDAAASLANIGTTAQKIPASIWTGDMANNGVTPDSTTDGDLTITVAGDYMVNFQASFSTVAAGDAGIYQFHLRNNAVETYMGCHREMSGSSDTGSAGFSGIITLAASDVLTVYVESDNGSDTDDLTFQDVQFSVHLLKAS